MDHPECPRFRKSEERRQRIEKLQEEIRSEIETNLRDIGLKPERMSSLVRNAAIQGARAQILAEDASLVDATYDEVSREGNVKPVTHPLYIQATSAASAYTNTLKQLGIYAATNKVEAAIKEETPAEPSHLEALLSQIGKPAE